MKKKPRTKALLLFMAMALVMLLPTVTHSQNDGFFCDMDYIYRDGGGAYSIGTQQFGSNAYGDYNIGTQIFGQNPAPLGCGLIIMLAAGGAYALKKNKKTKQLIKKITKK